MTHFTVLGATGFIGSRLSAALRQRGYRVSAPARDETLTSRDLGHVIYAIGMTTDFRSRPFDTVTAHVGKLNEILRDCQFASLTYLSSTRVYQKLSGVVDERTPLVVDSSQAGDLYNLSKLLGESLALHSGRPTKVVRLSNVYGGDYASHNFLTSVLRAAVTTGNVTLHTSAASAKDYIHVDDVIGLLPRIALEGRASIYNVCSGTNVSNAALAVELARHGNCRIQYAADAATVVFPRLSNARVRAEFDFRPASLLGELPALVADFRQHLEPATC